MPVTGNNFFGQLAAEDEAVRKSSQDYQARLRAAIGLSEGRNTRTVGENHAVARALNVAPNTIDEIVPEAKQEASAQEIGRQRNFAEWAAEHPNNAAAAVDDTPVLGRLFGKLGEFADSAKILSDNTAGVLADLGTDAFTYMADAGGVGQKSQYPALMPMPWESPLAKLVGSSSGATRDLWNGFQELKKNLWDFFLRGPIEAASYFTVGLDNPVNRFFVRQSESIEKEKFPERESRTTIGRYAREAVKNAPQLAANVLAAIATAGASEVAPVANSVTKATITTLQRAFPELGGLGPGAVRAVPGRMLTTETGVAFPSLVPKVTKAGLDFAPAMDYSALKPLGLMVAEIAGGSYGELREKGVLPPQAMKAAAFNALAQAPLEWIGLDRFLGIFKSKTFRDTAIRMFGASATEFITEFLQQWPEFAAHEWALAGKRHPDDPTGQLGDFLARMTDSGALYETLVEGLESGVVGGMIGFAGGVGKVVYDRGAAMRAVDTSMSLSEMMALCEDTKLKQECPDMLENALEAGSGNVFAQKVYFPAQAALDLLEKGTDILTPLGVSVEQARTAAEQGVDLDVKMSSVAARLDRAGVEAFGQIMRETPDSPNVEEAAAVAASDDDREAAVEEAQKKKTARQEVRAEELRLAREIAATGTGLGYGRWQARMLVAHANAMARAYGVRAADVLKRMKVSVGSPADAAAQALEQGIVPQRSADMVRAQYEGTDQWMKAPNGQQTRLSEQQWCAVRTPEFKKFFGDWETDPKNCSVVVGEDGEPLVVYHGTPGEVGEDFAFDPKRIGRNGQAEGPGFYLTTDRGTAEGYAGAVGNVIEAFANIRNPMPVKQKRLPRKQIEKVIRRLVALEGQENGEDARDTFLSNYGDTYSDGVERVIRDVASSLADQNDTVLEQIGELRNSGADRNLVLQAFAEVTGYDGVISNGYGDMGEGGGTIYVAWFPTQIKSAQGNIGAFDASNPNIFAQSVNPEKEGGNGKALAAYREEIKGTPKEAALRELLDTLSLKAGAQESARQVQTTKQLDYEKRFNDKVSALADKAGVDLTDTESPLSNDIFVETLRRNIVEAAEQNENAIGWYAKKIQQMFNVAYVAFPELEKDEEARFAFIYALATTSNGLRVSQNATLARKAYRDWLKSGRKTMPGIGEGTVAATIKSTLEAFNKGHDLFQTIDEEIRFFMTEWTVAQIKMMGIPISGENVDTIVRGAARMGPKIGNGFFANLMGAFNALTMDRWFMRTFGRIRGRNTSETTEKIPGYLATFRSLVASEEGYAKVREGIQKATKKFGKWTEEQKAYRENGVDIADFDLSNDEDLIRLARILSQTYADAAVREEQLAHTGVVKKQKDGKEVTEDPVRNAINNIAKNTEYEEFDETTGRKRYAVEVLAPGGGTERAYIRRMMTLALDRVRAEKDELRELSMADAQAVLWYAEKLLLEQMIRKEVGEIGPTAYDLSKAPDYANAMAAAIKGMYDEDVKDGSMTAEEAEEKKRAVDEALAKDVEETADGRGFKTLDERGKELVFSRSVLGKLRAGLKSLYGRRGAEGSSKDSGGYAYRSAGEAVSGSGGRVLRGGRDNAGEVREGHQGPRLVKWSAGKELLKRLNAVASLVSGENLAKATVDYLESEGADPASAERFASALEARGGNAAIGAGLTREGLAGAERVFLDEKGESGFALGEGGRIIAAFAAPGSGKLHYAVECAKAAGARNLTTSTLEDVPYFAAHGFVPAAVCGGNVYMVLDESSNGVKTGAALRDAPRVATDDEARALVAAKTEGLRPKNAPLEWAVAGDQEAAPLTLSQAANMDGETFYQRDPETYNQLVDAATTLLQTAWVGGWRPIQGRLSLKYIGTGDGAKFHGWGLYFAKNREVSDIHYRKRLVREAIARGDLKIRAWRGKKEITDQEEIVRLVAIEERREEKRSLITFLKRELASIRRDLKKAEEAGDAREVANNRKRVAGSEKYLAQQEQALEEMGKELGGAKVQIPYGSLTKVEIPPNASLLVDGKPLSEQSDEVKAAIRRLEPIIGTEAYQNLVKWNPTGSSLYFGLVKHFTPKGAIIGEDASMQASLVLRDVGIPGKMYDGTADGDPGQCFVIWDESVIDIVSSKSDKSAQILQQAAPDLYQQAVDHVMTLLQRAWHGSPHEIVGGLSLSKVGTGEGQQVHGWGLYFAQSRKISDERYRKRLSSRRGEAVVTDQNGAVVKEPRRGQLLAKWRLAQRHRKAIETWEEQRQEIDAALEYVLSVEEEALEGDTAELGADEGRFSNRWSSGYLLDKGAKRQARKRTRGTTLSSEEPKLTYEDYFNAADYLNDGLALTYEPIQSDLTRLEEELKGYTIRQQQGTLLEMEIPENDVLLDEDLPFSQQPPTVQSAVRMMEDVLGKRKLDRLIGEDARGVDIYDALTDVFIRRGMSSGRAAKAASLELLKAGLPGLTYVGKIDGRCFVIWDETAIQIIDRYEQMQAASGGIRGQVSLTPQQAAITIFKGDLSTIPHEAAHVFIDDLKMIAESDGSDARRTLREALEKAGIDTAPYESVLGGTADIAVARGLLRDALAQVALGKQEGQDRQKKRQALVRRLKKTDPTALSAEDQLSLFNELVDAGAQQQTVVDYIDGKVDGDAVAADLAGAANTERLGRSQMRRLADALGDYVRQIDGLEQARADIRTLRRFAGVPEDGELTREQWTDVQEYAARGFEQYLSEGKAPVTELEGFFARMKEWLKNLYSSWRAYVGAELTDEVRRVYDRLLATEVEVKTDPTVQAALSEEEEFLSMADLTEEERRDLDDLRSKAEAEASAKRDRELKRNYAKLYRENLAAAEDILMGDPFWAMVREMTADARRRKTPEEKGKPRTGGIKKSSLVEYLGEAMANELAKKVPGLVNAQGGGTPVDQLLFEEHYSMGIEADADAIANRLYDVLVVQGRTFRSECRSLAEQMTDEQTGQNDPVEGAFLGGEEYERYLANVDKALRRLSREAEKDPKRAAEAEKAQAALPAAYYRNLARQEVEGMAASNLSTAKWVAALKRALSDRSKAVLRGRPMEAVRAMERARFAFAMMQEVKKARDTASHVQEKIRKAVAAKPGTYPAVQTEALRKLAAALGFPVADRSYDDSVKDTPFVDLVRQAVGDESAIDLMPMFPDWLLNLVNPDERAAQRDEPLAFNKLTADEMGYVADVVDFLVHTGREQNRANAASLAARTEALATEAAGAMSKLKTFYAAARDSIFRWLANLFSSVDTLEWQCRKADAFSNVMGREGSAEGVMEREVYQPLRRAMDRYYARLGETQRPVAPLCMQLMKSARQWGKQYGRRQLNIRDEAGRLLEVPDAMKRAGIHAWKPEMVIALALNLGNAGNRERLLASYHFRDEDNNVQPGGGLTYDTVSLLLGDDAALALFGPEAAQMSLDRSPHPRREGLLSAEDWRAVQGIWNVLGSQWGDTQKAHKAIYGFAPRGVDPEAFTVNVGGEAVNMAGGYYPITYDPEIDAATKAQEEKNDILDRSVGLFAPPTAKKGFTMARVTHTGRSIRLGTDVLMRHLTDSARFIELADDVRKADKVFMSQTFQGAYIRAFGLDDYGRIRPNLKSLVVDEPAPTGAMYRLAEWCRNHMTYYVLGLNLNTAILQLTAAFPAMGDIGGVNFLRGLGQLAAHGPSLVREVWKASPYMERRYRNIDADIARKSMQFNPGGRTLIYNGKVFQWGDIVNLAMMPIGIADATISTAIWTAAYHKKLSELTGQRTGGAFQYENEHHAASVEYADRVVAQSNPDNDSLSKSAFARDKGIVRLFNSFTSATTKFAQRTRYMAQGVRHGQVSKWELGRMEMFDLLLTAVAMALIKGAAQGLLGSGDDDDQKDLAALFGQMTVEQMAMVVPVLGNPLADLATGLMHGETTRRGGGILGTPISTGGELASNLVEGIAALFTGKDDGDKMLMSSLAIGSYLAMIPGYPFGRRIARGYEQWQEGRGTPMSIFMPRNN